ncbi:MAG: hypothetical protein ACJAY8_001191 [Sphingobacteriales bacterium]|jgi:hypothetical protein
MKKIVLISLAAFSLSFSSYLFPNSEEEIFSHNPPGASTGAPGENNCTQCHAGQAMSATGFGEVTISGDGTYSPNEEYIVSVQLNSPGNKNGFQLVVLDDNGSSIGTLETNASDDLVTRAFNGKNYVSHSSTGSLSGSWEFTWVAPSASSGDVTFYYSLNKANGNGNSGGDQIFLGNTSVADGSISVGEMNNLIFDFTAFQNESTLMLEVPNTMGAPISFNLTDVQGRSMGSDVLNEYRSGIATGQVNLSGLNSGVYLVHVFRGNQGFSKKIWWESK